MFRGSFLKIGKARLPGVNLLSGDHVSKFRDASFHHRMKGSPHIYHRLRGKLGLHDLLKGYLPALLDVHCLGPTPRPEREIETETRHGQCPERDPIGCRHYGSSSLWRGGLVESEKTLVGPRK